MIEKKDVEHLAELSRLEFSDTEIEKFQKDLGSILEYVDQVKEVSASIDLEPTVGDVHNVLRPGEDAHQDGEHQKEIVGEFPKQEDGYLKVKKILN